MVLNTAAMHYALMQREHKKVLYLHDIEGSFDDDVNLKAAIEIHNQGYNTVLPNGGEVASGGSDFFLAGVKRAIQGDYKYGVHSWGGGDDDVKAIDLPKNHEEHDKYLSFYKEVGIDSAFYWYTIESAPEEGMHWMSVSEMDKFKLVNATYQEAIE